MMRSPLQPRGLRDFQKLPFAMGLALGLCTAMAQAQQEAHTPDPAAEQEEVIRIPRQTLNPADLELPEPPRTDVSTARTDASAEELRDRPKAYMARFSARLRLPAPAETWEAIIAAQPELGEHRSWLEQLFGSETLQTSPLYPAHYQARARDLQRRSAVFHDLPDATRFYDLHALLKTPSAPAAARPALLLQGEFTRRGSTRAIEDFESGQDPTEVTYNPVTSYRWPRSEKADAETTRLQQSSRAVLNDLETEYAVVGLPRKRNRALEAGIAQRKAELELLPQWSYLDSGEVPFVVLPPVYRQFAGQTLSPELGDLALLLIGDQALPAIFGDETADPGQAQLSPALWEAAAPATGANAGPETVRAALLLFPGTADPETLQQAPDSQSIRERVAQIYRDLSGQALPPAPNAPEDVSSSPD
jgi:hypothetical protein